MDKLLGILNISGLGSRGARDDDFIDRLNHRYTTWLLAIFAIVVTSRQYVGDPINCWAPAHFTSNYIDYTNKICWVSNTYFLPFDIENIPDHREPAERINYYQWVPMILMAQALFFYLPSAIWDTLNTKTGLDLPGINDAAYILTCVDVVKGDSRDDAINRLAYQIHSYLLTTHNYNKGCCKMCCAYLSKNACKICGRRLGNYLLGLYLVIKFVYVMNAILQLFLLNAFLSTDYHVYGMEIMAQVLGQSDWISPRFPRVTLCDFQVRALANTHRHTVQCVLPINLFNEKIFMFIWFWLVLLAICSALNFIVWLSRVLFTRNQQYFVKRHLQSVMPDQQDRDDVKKRCAPFVNEYLRHDGMLLFQLMEHNANHLITAEILSALWKFYLEKPPNLNQSPSMESMV